MLIPAQLSPACRSGPSSENLLGWTLLGPQPRELTFSQAHLEVDTLTMVEMLRLERWSWSRSRPHSHRTIAAVHRSLLLGKLVESCQWALYSLLGLSGWSTEADTSAAGRMKESLISVRNHYTSSAADTAGKDRSTLADITAELADTVNSWSHQDCTGYLGCSPE